MDKRPSSGRVLSMPGKKRKVTMSTEKNAGISLASACYFAVSCIIIIGAFYLYQVNEIATKGYEIWDLQNQIGQLEKNGKEMQIREVELRSMYNIEQSTQDLGLVNAQNVSYIQMSSPVAMNPVSQSGNCISGGNYIPGC